MSKYTPTPSSNATPGDVTNLDRQIEQLLECKPLPEAEVKHLCEKVQTAHFLLFFNIFLKGQRSPY